MTDRRWDSERQEWVYPGDWRPIASAPKDGTRILLAVLGTILIGKWSDEAKFFGGESGQAWQIFECDNDEYYSEATQMATHWMPLPDPPK